MVTAGNILALSLIIFVASAVRGFTGFGLALVAVPLIQFFLPVSDTAVFIAVINFIFSIAYFRRSRELVKEMPLSYMAVTTGIGVAGGALILKYVFPSYIQLVWGILIVLFVALLYSGRGFNIRAEKTAMALSGIFGGILAGSTGIIGPPVAVILSSMKTTKEKFNAVISVFIFFAVTYGLFFYMLTGLIRRDTLILGLCSVPALIAGLYTGDRIVSLISQKLFTSFVYVVLLIMGIVTILKGLNGLFHFM